MPPGATAPCTFSIEPDFKDPYRYQAGFGNRFESEAIPGVLPRGRNVPQRCKYDLYSEQLNGAPVVSSRANIQHVWMYRIRPSVAHGSIIPSPELNQGLESCFLPLNKNVQHTASQKAWLPFPVSCGGTEDEDHSGQKDFIQGISTIGGQGDASLREGVAIHIYRCCRSMTQRAFSNNDGDLLILPETGRLQIQTELGWMMVRPGELVVIQAGIRFRVLLPDGPSRGYIQEIFGAHYELPELGPLGSNSMALPRDFESPVAAFEIDASLWEVVYKTAGTLQTCHQNHTPFDVVGWHGNLVPYKYALEKFINVANANWDQADPTIYCVLTAHSRVPSVSLTDFLAFTPKWLATTDTFRPPYYHRNMSTEIMGVIYGRYREGPHTLEPGGLSYEAAYMPHGESYETWRTATTRELLPEKVLEDTLSFMFHISAPVLLTQWAIHGEGAATLQDFRPERWDGLKAHFLDHLDEINLGLAKAGRPPLGDPASMA